MVLIGPSVPQPLCPSLTSPTTKPLPHSGPEPTAGEGGRAEGGVGAQAGSQHLGEGWEPREVVTKTGTQNAFTQRTPPGGGFFHSGSGE